MKICGEIKPKVFFTNIEYPLNLRVRKYGAVGFTSDNSGLIRLIEPRKAKHDLFFI